MERDKQERSSIEKLISLIKEKGGIKYISLKELLKPKNYAERISQEADLKRVQLRRLFTEFKNLYEEYKKAQENRENIEKEIKPKLYKLYPLLQYQANRKLIPENFKSLMFEILDNIENDFENFENAMEFLTALVAYTKKES